MVLCGCEKFVSFVDSLVSLVVYDEDFRMAVFDFNCVVMKRESQKYGNLLTISV